MAILSTIKSYVVAGAAAIGAILLAALYVVKGQRDDARESAQKAKASMQVSEKTRKVEECINEAAQAAREESRATEQENEERPSDRRPGGSFRR